MANMKQNQAFSKAVLCNFPLDDGIDWIRDNMDLEDVFTEKQLKNWAQSMEPEDLFTEEELGEWARSHGFVKDTGDE